MAKEVSICKLGINLLNILEKYPNYDDEDITSLFSDSKTEKIAKSLLKRDMLHLSIEDFEKIDKSGEFIFKCGLYIRICGMESNDITFINLSIDLLKGSRKYLGKDTEIYAKSLVEEGLANQLLAYNGVDPMDNLKKAIKIYNSSYEGVINNKNYHKAILLNKIQIREIFLNYGVGSIDNVRKLIELYEKERDELLDKDSQNYINSLKKELNAFLILIRNQSSEHDLRKSITFFREVRKGAFKKGTQEHIASLSNESIALQGLVEMGACSIEESIDNLENAIKICENIRKIEKGTLVYVISLLEEGSSRSKLAAYEKNPVNNLKKAIHLFELARIGFEKENDKFGYALTLMNEANTRRELADLGIYPKDNLKKSIELSERSRREGLEEGTPYYTHTLVNQGSAIIDAAQFEKIGTQIDNLNYANELFKRAKGGYEKGTRSYASSLIKEGKSKVSLTDFGFNSIEDLNNIRNLFIDARNEVGTNTPEYIASLVEEGILLLRMAEIEKDWINSIAYLNNAIDFFQRSREVTLLKDTHYYAASLVEEALARILLSKNGIKKKYNLKKAIKAFKIAKDEEIVKDISIRIDNLNYARILLNEGTARSELAKIDEKLEDNLNEAESLYIKAKTIFIKQNDKIGIINSCIKLGEFFYFQNRMNEAYNHLKEAIDLVEDMRSSIKILEIRKKYFETVINLFDTMVFTCISLGRYNDAFKYVEASKGRIFLDLLANEKKKIKGNKELISEYKDILNQIDKIDTEIDDMELKFVQGREIDYDYRDNLRLKLIKLVKYQDELLLKIKQSDPEYYNIKTVEPVNVEEIDLKNKTLVEYFLGKKLAIFILNKENLIVKEIEIDQNEILSNFIKLRNIIEKENNVLAGEEILKYFYNLLIDPIKSNLADELIIIPHKYLHAIPFQALKGNNYLIEDYKISFAQSASSLKFLNPGTGNGALVVGNPTGDLNDSEEEAIEIAKILKTEALIKGEAKKDTVLKEIQNKKIIHLACHGSFNLFNPYLSKLKLSDGYIRIKDLMNLDINANLIVLSACESGLGSITHGDEFEGLIRAIQLGNCRFVIASLWPVADNSTKELFLEFYNGKGDTIDRLRNAELQLMKKYDFDKWAAFQVYGI